MPTLPCCARPFLAAHYSTPRDFFDAIAKGSNESSLRRIVDQGAPFFVGGRGYRLVVEHAGRASGGKPVDVRLERNWRELGWFRRVVLTLLSGVLPRDRQHCERPCRAQLPAVLHTITRLRQPTGMAVPTVPPPKEQHAPAGSGVVPDISVYEPPPRITPVLTPAARRVRQRFLAECIAKANGCALFAHKAEWCNVVRTIAGNDPPECHDVVAAVVLAHMAAVVNYLRRNRAGNESAYAEVLGILQALHDAGDITDEELAKLAARLTVAWKRHWWRGEIPWHTAFAEFRLPVGVAQRIGAYLRKDWLLVTDEFGTLELRDREIKRLIAAASAKSTPADGADGADSVTGTANVITGPAAPSPAIG